MRKRIAVLALAFAILAVPHLAVAQQPGKVARIGYLSPGPAIGFASRIEAFVDGLRAHGWVIGQNAAIEYRWGGGGAGSLGDLAAELIRLQMDVIFAVNTLAALATQKTGTKIPVVFAAVSEPIETGLVASLARPGGNITGLTTLNRELMPKRLELLKEAVPGLARVGYLANPANPVHQPQLKEMRAAAQSLGMDLHLFEVRDAPGLERAFGEMAAARVGAFVVQQGPPFANHRQRVFELAARVRVPGMYISSFFTQEGGLISYGANAEDLYRRAATYVDKILRGAKPADLPVERPTKFELVINLKTAKALGLTIPPEVLLRADRVIK